MPYGPSFTPSQGCYKCLKRYHKNLETFFSIIQKYLASHSHCSKHCFWNFSAGLKTTLVTVMINPTMWRHPSSHVWPSVCHKCPTVKPCTHHRTDVLQKCLIYHLKRRSTPASTTGGQDMPQNEVFAISQWTLMRTVPRANSASPQTVWRLCTYGLEVWTSFTLGTTICKRSAPRFCQGTLSGECSPWRHCHAKPCAETHAKSLLNGLGLASQPSTATAFHS